MEKKITIQLIDGDDVFNFEYYTSLDFFLVFDDPAIKQMVYLAMEAVDRGFEYDKVYVNIGFWVKDGRS